MPDCTIEAPIGENRSTTAAPMANASRREDELPPLAKVSIIIVTYKGDDVLRDCLDSLRKTCGEMPQIVVVDNSPSDETKCLVAGYPNAVYVESPGNPGFAGGNNKAIPFCNRRYILLLNNDTVVKTSKSITDLVDFIENTPSCGVVQGSIVLPNLDGKAGGCGSFLTPFGFQYARGFGVSLESPGLNRPVRCFSIIGAFMLFPKDILQGTGGFLFYDHFKSYYEESDFCHRVWLSGKEVWYIPTDPIEHLCGHTSGMFPRTEIMRQYIRNSFFSLKVNLSWWGRLMIVLNYRMVMWIHALVHLLRGDRTTYQTDMAALSDVAKEKHEIRAARVSLNRRVSDFWVFWHILRLPAWGYLIRSLRQNA